MCTKIQRSHSFQLRLHSGAAELVPAADWETKPAWRAALPAASADLLLRTAEIAAPQIMFSWLIGPERFEGQEEAGWYLSQKYLLPRYLQECWGTLAEERWEVVHRHKPHYKPSTQFRRKRSSFSTNDYPYLPITNTLLRSPVTN